MEGLNRVQLLGNLGAEPELRQTGAGAVLKLRLATSETFLDKDKQKQERTEWHTVTLWGKRAEGLARVLAKGSRLFVEGGLRTSSYEKDGQKRYTTEVVASNILLQGGGPARASAPTAAPRVPVAEGAEDDDIPF
jgi:single-strand DNA-binding protein